MKIEIKNRYTGEVIYSCEADSLREAVEKAVTDGADLRGADLSGADLRGADLREADLNAIFYKAKITKEQKEIMMTSTSEFLHVSFIQEVVKEIKREMIKSHLSEQRDGRNMGLFHCDACKDLAIYKDHKFKQGLIWECPSFVSKHYNCLQPFENSTGKYCGKELVCQNQWEEERK